MVPSRERLAAPVLQIKKEQNLKDCICVLEGQVRYGLLSCTSWRGRLEPRRLEERRLHTERLNIREKGHSRFLRQFLSGKISDFFYSEYSKIRIWTSIKGSGNNYEKILSSF